MYNHLLFQYQYYYQSSFHVLIIFHLFIQSFTHSLNTCMQLFIVSASSVLLLLFIYFIIIHYYTYCYYLFTVSVFTYVERSCLAASSDTCDNKIGYGSCSCSTTYCNSQARISVFTPLLLLTALVVWAQRS